MKINKWLFRLVLLLLIVSVTALITILYNKSENKTYEYPEQAVSFDSDESMRYSGRWFRDELGFTRDQMQEFSSFNPLFRQNIRDINLELNRLKRSMLEEMNASQIDTSKLNQLSDSIGNLHSSLKKVTWSYYLELKRISEPDQQEKLKQIFEGIFDGIEPAYGPGRGMQGGRGRGIRRGNQ